jgi:hypothetical protein
VFFLRTVSYPTARSMDKRLTNCPVVWQKVVHYAAQVERLST